MAFIAPVLDEVIGGIYDVVFVAVAGAIAHQLEYTLNGVDWIVIDDNIITAPDGSGNIVYPWDTVVIPDSVDVQLRARGVFAGFDPLDIDDCIVFLKSDAITGVTGGTSLNQWDDQSGNNNHFTAPGTAPLYISVDGEHDWPTVQFQRSRSDWLQGPNLSSLTGAEALLVTRILVDPPPATGNHESYPSMWQFGTHEFDSHYPWAGDGVVYEGFGSNARKTIGNPTPSLDVTRRYRVLTAANLFTTWLDAAQLFTTASNTVAFNTTPYLGRSRLRHWDGFLFALIIYSRTLTTQERSDLETWASRYQTDRADVEANPDITFGPWFESALFDTENVIFEEFNILAPINGSTVEAGITDIIWDTPTTENPLPPGVVIEYEVEVDYGNGVFITLAIGLLVNTTSVDLYPYVGRTITIRVIATAGLAEIDAETTFSVIAEITSCILIEPIYQEVQIGQEGRASCGGIDASLSSDDSIVPTFDSENCPASPSVEDCP